MCSREARRAIRAETEVRNAHMQEPNRHSREVSLAFVPYALSTKDLWIDTFAASAIIFIMYPLQSPPDRG